MSVKNNKMYFSIDYSQIMKENKQSIIMEGFIVSEGSNLHETYFSLDAINNAFPSIANIPVICIHNGIDFKEHARTLTDEYQVQKIGMVPESNRGEIVEKNNKKWQKIDLIIWKAYADEAIRTLLQHQSRSGKTKLSMEIDILESHKRPEDGLLEIDKYVYTAICLLGENYTSAVPDANVSIIKYANIPDKDIETLNKAYFSLVNSERKEVDTLKQLMSILKEKFAKEKSNFKNFVCDEKYIYADIDGKKYKYEYSMNEENKEYSINFTSEVLYAESNEDTKKTNSEDNKEKDSDKEKMAVDDKEKSKKDDSTKKPSNEKFSLSEITAIVTENEKLKNEISELNITIQKYAKKETTEKAQKLYSDNKDFLTNDEIELLDKKLFSVPSFDAFENEVNKIILPKIRAKLSAKPLDNKQPNIDFFSLSNKNIDNTNQGSISAFIKGV